jgi:hypothetical protein
MYLGWDVGIKNLAYCLLDMDYSKDIPKIIIKKWGIINLLEHKPEKWYCNCNKKNGDPCGKKASYKINDDRLCATHLKQKQKKLDSDKVEQWKADLEEWTDKLLCSEKKCSKVATRFSAIHNKYYCTKHAHIDEGKKDVINQNSAIRMPLMTLGKILYKKLDEIPELKKAKWVAIENQPVLKNPTMKSVQMMLYSYFVMKENTSECDIHELLLMNAKNKLKVYNDEYGEIDPKIKATKDKYKRNKLMAIEHTKLYTEFEHPTWNDFYLEHSKKDDLADAYLMTRFLLNKMK